MYLRRGGCLHRYTGEHLFAIDRWMLGSTLFPVLTGGSYFQISKTAQEIYEENPSLSFEEFCEPIEEEIQQALASYKNLWEMLFPGSFVQEALEGLLKVRPEERISLEEALNLLEGNLPPAQKKPHLGHESPVIDKT